MRLSSAPSRRLSAALGLLLPLWLGACAATSGCQKTAASDDAGAAAVQDLSPVPAPEGLIGDLLLPTPEATWAKARVLVGGPAVFLPQQFGGLAVTLLKLPITVAGEIDGGVPVVGAALKQGTEPAFGAIGIHVRAGDRFIDQLTRGEQARFTAEVDQLSRITVLTPKQRPADGGSFILGVLGNYLLVAERMRDLQAAGPYVARSVSVRAPPKEDLAFEMPEASLSGPVMENLRLQWGRVKNEMDNANMPLTPFGSTVSAALDVLGDAKQARLTVEIDPAAAHARFTIAPKPGEGPATRALKEMVVGDARPLLELPANTQIGLLWRDSGAARAADVPAQADALAKLIGEAQVSADDKAAIAAALRAEGEARGEWATIGLGLEPRGLGATARVAVADADKTSKALKQLTDLAKLSGLKTILKENSLAISTDKIVVENLAGDVQRVRFERTDKMAKAKAAAAKDKKPLAEANAKDDIPSSIDLLYLVKPEVLLAAVGGDPKEALRALEKAPGDANLGKLPAVQGALEALGGELAYALVVDPIRLAAARMGKSAPPEPAPVVFAVGKVSGAGLLLGQLDVPASTIQEIIKHRDAV